jgi:CBS domain containing-hemolysin-like protein
MTLLLLYAALAIGVSFLCSLLEASLLSVPGSHVDMLVERGSPVGKSLKRLKEHIDRPLAAILTLNTIAHTVGAAGVGAQAAVVFGSTALGIASALMTLAILVISEIIPKTLGAVHAKKLTTVTVLLTTGMIWLCWPLILVLEWMNRLIGYQRRTQRLSRMEVLATIRLGSKVGSLADREYRITMNAMALENVQLSKIMTPRTVVFALPASTTARQALNAHQPIRFARIPVYGESIDDVLGYVARYDLHEAVAEGRGEATMRELMRPIVVLPELASVGKAMEQMLSEHEHIAMVIDEHGGMEGIVTLEDVMETLLGQEIIDETDPATDMQMLARRRAGS